MDEYIVDTSKIEHVPQISKEAAYEMLFGECGVPLYERIVRCRDCQHYMEHCEYFDNEPACLRCGSELDGYDAFTTVPDGFCAWGEPKD